MNNDPPPSPPRRSWGRTHWGAVGIVTVLFVALVLPVFQEVEDITGRTTTAGACMQIIMAMKIWANDHQGHYPDSAIPNAKSSNEVFRRLVMDDIIQDERIFGAKQSPYLPDGRTGTAPGFTEAVGPGENHWMIIAGPNAKSNGILPIIFENTLDASWPLTWRGDQPGKRLRGRTWRDGKIIIGRNDNSVNVETLVRENGVNVLPPQLRQMFEESLPKPIRVLDIEER